MNLQGIDEIEHYASKFRREDFEKLKTSKIFDLFPEEQTDFPKAPLDWNKDSWPNGNKSGVYLVYNKEQKLIYIGTARHLGNRLGVYFGAQKKCQVKQVWGDRPRYLITVGVPDETWFEAHSLEAYLISKLNPPLNTVGKN